MIDTPNVYKRGSDIEQKSRKVVLENVLFSKMKTTLSQMVKKENTKYENDSSHSRGTDWDLGLLRIGDKKEYSKHRNTKCKFKY